MTDVTDKHLFLDTENRAPVNIKKVGGYKHARECECILFPFARGDRKVRLWAPLERDMPAELEDALLDDQVLKVAHNGGMYDRLVLLHALGFDIPIEQWWDTMAQAYSMGLPGALEDLGPIIGLDADQQKIADGKKLITKFCTPRRPSKANPDKYWNRHTKPEEWERFKLYAVNDVVAMREIFRYLPDWGYRGPEREIWFLDQKINDRGIRIDVDGIHAVQDAVRNQRASLDRKTSELTGGQIASTTQRNELVGYLDRECGVKTDSIDKANVVTLLDAPHIPEKAKDLLRLRQLRTRSSTAKFEKMLDAANESGRGLVLQGMFQWAGAFRTRRWAGRLVQLQNMPRGDFEGEAVYLPLEAATLGIMEVLYDDPMSVAASLVRPVLVAAEGARLDVSDLSNIEGRGVAYLAGEEWKLQAFRDFDAGIGPDIYKLSYSESFGVPLEDVGKPERQVGKVEELGGGYEGGVGAYQTMARIYGVDFGDTYDTVWKTATRAQRERALEARARDLNREKFTELTDRQYLATDCIKQLWRAKHPKIVALWRNTNNAAKAAVRNPGKTYRAGKVKWRVALDWLLAILPSGFALAYYKPSVRDGKLHFWGSVQLPSGQTVWREQSTYGGALVENITQGFARDILAHAMLAIDRAGFDIVGHVHDEVICETPLDSELGLSELDRLLATPPAWAPDIPLAAAGYSAQRYRKD